MIDRKKLKEEYKNAILAKGIFIIKNNKTGKVDLPPFDRQVVKFI